MFPSVVGQKTLLNKLKFFLDIQNVTGILPPILITGQRGGGKNTLGNAIIRNLYSLKDKTKHKTAIEINCSSIKTANQFFEEIVDVYLVDKDVTLILDEIHAWEGTDLIDVFLSIWNTKNGQVNQYIHNGNTYIMDLRRISWIALTSEANKLPETIISRLEVFQLEELSLDDLSRIVLKNLNEIKVTNNELIKEVASTCRRNGRESYKLANNIYSHLKKNKKDTFDYEDWHEIRKSLNIRPLGVNNIEYRILTYLSKHNNGVSLSKLSSALQMTSDATRLGFERYLLGNDFLEVVNAKGRILTKKGRDYLTEVKE